jgi:hypothetical protein
VPRGRARKFAEIETDESPESKASELELTDFFDSIGPEGVSEVSLYRVLANNGKQKFICSGPPTQFTEAYIQATYGGGDYLLRARLDGKYYRSKMISVESPNLPNGTNGTNGNHTDELERLRLQIQDQQVRMEAERQAALQRNHELMLAVVQHGNGGTATPQMSIADMVAAVKNLNDMGNQGAIDAAIDRVFNLASKVQQLTNPQAASGEGSWWDWAKPVVQEAAKTILPKVLPFGNAAPTAAPPMPPTIPQASAPTVHGPEQVPTESQPAMTDQERFDAEFRAQKHEALAFALGMARLGRSPEFWADSAVEQVETTNNQITARFLAEIMQAENFGVWFADLEKIDPGVITQKGWFETFYQTVRETISAKAEPPEQ